MITKEYADFSWQQAEQLLSIDSPSEIGGAHV